jgi:hypothetical protein
VVVGRVLLVGVGGGMSRRRMASGGDAPLVARERPGGAGSGGCRAGRRRVWLAPKGGRRCRRWQEESTTWRSSGRGRPRSRATGKPSRSCASSWHGWGRAGSRDRCPLTRRQRPDTLRRGTARIRPRYRPRAPVGAGGARTVRASPPARAQVARRKARAQLVRSTARRDLSAVGANRPRSGPVESGARRMVPGGRVGAPVPASLLVDHRPVGALAAVMGGACCWVGGSRVGGNEVSREITVRDRQGPSDEAVRACMRVAGLSHG